MTETTELQTALLARIDALAAKLGVTGEAAFVMAVDATHAAGVAGAAVAAALFALSAALLYAARRLFGLSAEYPDDCWEMGGFAACTAAAFCALFALVGAENAYPMIVAPEGSTLRSIFATTTP
jgi:hypothetical protein